jgi:phospho-N-acetylmuramoyl-pentapeptide-transferase
MMMHLFYFLSMLLGIKIPAAFSYYSTRMLLSSGSALVITILLGPWFIQKLYELKIGHTVRVEDCPALAGKYTKKRDIPSMGGVLILTAILFSGLFWLDFSSPFTWILVVATLWFGLLGGVDDYLKLKRKNHKGLTAKKKFFFQVLFALVVSGYFFSPLEGQTILAKERVEQVSKSLTVSEYAMHYYIPFYKKPIVLYGVLGVILSTLMTVFVITGSVNAVNLADGLDGLATGCLLFTTSVLGVVAFLSNNFELSRYLNILYIEGSGEIGVFLSAVMGACVGFLWYNAYPAQVFMGDTGSLGLGGILGVSAVLLRREFLYAIVAGVFVAEALSVILQVASFRFRGGKRIFLCAPLHHHFEYKGLPETKIVIRFWMVSLLLALLGLVSLRFQ